MKQNRKNRWQSIALLLGVLSVCACTKVDQPTDNRSQGNVISFSKPILQPVSTLTKAQAGVVSDQYNPNERFRVFAQWDQFGFLHWGEVGQNGVASAPYLDGVTTRYDDVLDGWITCDESGNPTPYEWPLSGVLTFAAYSPADLVPTHASEADYGRTMVEGIEHSGLKIKGFKVNRNIEEQIDLMYGKRSYNKRSSASDRTSPTYHGVDLVFHHALSLINFRFHLDHANGREVYLNKLTLSDASIEGDFHEWIYESEANPDSYLSDNNHRKWDAVNVNAGSGIVFTIFEAKTQAEEVKLEEITDSTPPFMTHPLMMIPQRFAQSVGPGGAILDAPDARIEIVLRMQDHSLQTTSFPLKDLSASWQAGKSYTYTVSVGATAIEFQPGISEWGTNGTEDVIVNPS